MQQGSQKPMVSSRSGVGTGTTSLLMIFTVLCFATLAMLSISTAASQQRIHQRGMDNAVAVAGAKGEAAALVAELDAGLLQLAQAGGAESDYYAKAEALAKELGATVDAEAHTLTFVVAVTPPAGEGEEAAEGNTELVTELKLEAPGGAARYTIVRQNTRIRDGWQPQGGELLTY